MKTLKLTLLLAGGLVAAAPLAFSADAPATAAARAPAFKAHILSRGELDKLLAQPGKTLVIDVRRPDEVTDIGGLPVYLSIQAKDLEAGAAWIPRDRNLVLISNHAGRAGKAADLLSSKGFKVAGAAGVQLYEKDGGKVTHIAKPAVAATAAASTGGHN